ncbi:unnamed protein product, partial [Urochloa humidicola]
SRPLLPWSSAPPPSAPVRRWRRSRLFRFVGSVCVRCCTDLPGFSEEESAGLDTIFANEEQSDMSQKFAPKLDQLVDMTKVNLDSVKPWIANRVAQLLRREDEIVTNFIYSHLEGKEVDGKKIQIQLTGFMEKNTVKFMEEL